MAALHSHLFSKVSRGIVLFLAPGFANQTSQIEPTGERCYSDDIAGEMPPLFLLPVHRVHPQILSQIHAFPPDFTEQQAIHQGTQESPPKSCVSALHHHTRFTIPMTIPLNTSHNTTCWRSLASAVPWPPPPPDPGPAQPDPGPDLQQHKVMARHCPAIKKRKRLITNRTLEVAKTQVVFGLRIKSYTDGMVLDMSKFTCLVAWTL